jgi:hypothetical protein
LLVHTIFAFRTLLTLDGRDLQAPGRGFGFCNQDVVDAALTLIREELFFESEVKCWIVI